MARYEHLPIYKAALDVAVGVEKLGAGFWRYHKYTLGTLGRNFAMAVAVCWSKWFAPTAHVIACRNCWSCVNVSIRCY